MRLTFNLGYSGYSEFQKALQEILRGKASPQTRLEANLMDSNNSDLFNHYVEKQIKSINSTVDMLASNNFNEAIDLITSAKHVYCTSVRSGLPIAQFLTHGLNRLQGNCDLVQADLSDWIDRVVDFNSSDLIIALSFPRYASRIEHLVKNAKERNAKILLLTDSYSAPLVKYADILLPCSSSSIASHNSIISSMLVADFIVSAVAVNNPKQTKHRLDQVNKIMTDMNYHIK